MKNRDHFTIIAEAIKYIKANHMQQPNLEAIANHVHMSKYHFQRLFQKWAGVSPKVFLQYITVAHAKKLLQAGHSTLETAYAVGLSGNGRLHDTFIKIESCSPGSFKKRGMGMQIYYDKIITPFGDAIVAETYKGICKITFTKTASDTEALMQQEFPNAFFSKGLKENGALVQQYFKSWKAPKQNIGLHLQGTPFQIQVWKALLQIPTSQLVSYRHIAAVIHRPKAVRAVGTAIGKNPIAYLIPCHRVIRQTGEMGEYRWKTERKMAIHAYECLHL